jgi:hypothetical protein
MSTIYRPVNRGVYSSNIGQTGQLGAATLRVSNLLAVGSLIFGGACAAFIPASLEQRIGAVFFFGLIPAVGFHAGGFVLSLLLGFSSELCERVAILCFRYFERVISDTVRLWSAPRSYATIEYLLLLTRYLLWKMSELTRSASRSIHRGCHGAETALFEFSCLIIRSAARFIIRMQASQRLKRCR